MGKFKRLAAGVLLGGAVIGSVAVSVPAQAAPVKPASTQAVRYCIFRAATLTYIDFGDGILWAVYKGEEVWGPDSVGTNSYYYYKYGQYGLMDRNDLRIESCDP